MAKLTLEALIDNVQSTDETVRAAARDDAGSVGAEAVVPLANIATGQDMDISRAAQRALQNIVYHAGRPGAGDEAKAVTGKLLKLLGDSQPMQFRREVLWMTWQIGGEEAVEPVALLLRNSELHEDARMALERLPGEGATAALQSALASATEAQKPALAYSLGVRGVTISGVPDLRLKPTKETSTQPVGR